MLLNPLGYQKSSCRSMSQPTGITLGKIRPHPMSMVDAREGVLCSIGKLGTNRLDPCYISWFRPVYGPQQPHMNNFYPLAIVPDLSQTTSVPDYTSENSFDGRSDSVFTVTPLATLRVKKVYAFTCLHAGRPLLSFVFWLKFHNLPTTVAPDFK